MRSQGFADQEVRWSGKALGGTSPFTAGESPYAGSVPAEQHSEGQELPNCGDDGLRIHPVLPAEKILIAHDR